MKRILDWLFFIGMLAWLLPSAPISLSGVLVLGLLIFLFKPSPP